MVTYNLIYADDEFGPARRVEFEAFDPHGALRIAQNQAVGRVAELWEGGRRLCTLKRTGDDGTIWEIGPGAQTPLSAGLTRAADAPRESSELA